jgi:hypothetical protein
MVEIVGHGPSGVRQSEAGSTAMQSGQMKLSVSSGLLNALDSAATIHVKDSSILI